MTIYVNIFGEQQDLNFNLHNFSLSCFPVLVLSLDRYDSYINIIDYLDLSGRDMYFLVKSNLKALYSNLNEHFSIGRAELRDFPLLGWQSQVCSVLITMTDCFMLPQTLCCIP
jgi:hypothetical protein